MDFNILFFICVSIMIISIYRGASKGMLRIVFGIIAWIFLIIFINYGSNILANYISTTTDIPTTVHASIADHLAEKYTESEAKEAGTGEEAVMVMIPKSIKDNIEEEVRSSIEATISAIAEELTDAAIKGISTIMALIIGIILIIIIDKLIKAIGLVPGLRDVNRLLGFVAGFAEGVLIIWAMMYIATCFPTSTFGQFVLTNVEKDELLYFVYQNNLITRIIGI